MVYDNFMAKNLISKILRGILYFLSRPTSVLKTCSHNPIILVLFCVSSNSVDVYFAWTILWSVKALALERAQTARIART